MNDNIQKPFFSIITPVYNAEKYLEKCIESVINQTYDSWEMILVDDGSTDESGSICDKYAYSPRIKVIHQQNAGELQSRVNGIAIAQGEYELGLDADDYLDTTCLETIKKAIDKSGSDLIFYAFRFVGSEEGEIGCSLAVNKEYSQEEILKEVILKTNHSLRNKAIKLDIVNQVKYEGLPSDIRFNLDYAQIIPIICKITSGYVIADAVYNYRIHQESISQLSKVSHILDTSIVTEFVVCELESAMLMSESIYESVYLAYFNMIGQRLMNLYIGKRITLEDLRKIHSQKAYIDSAKYEKYKYFNLYQYVTLKLFRYKQHQLLKMIAMMHRIKAKCLRR